MPMVLPIVLAKQSRDNTVEMIWMRFKNDEKEVSVCSEMFCFKNVRRV